MAHLLSGGKHLCTGGMVNLEITMNTPGADRLIKNLVENLGGELNIGAGTVCSYDDLQLALLSGATFIVTPVLEERIVKYCVERGIPVFPGAFSPTEIYRAWSLGASMVKIFPAIQLGASYIREILAPLSEIKLLPTGGVGLHNIREFFDAGAKGCGLGGHLFPLNMTENDRWNDLEDHLVQFKQTFEDITTAGNLTTKRKRDI